MVRWTWKPLGTALIFWWALVRLPRRGYGASAMHVFLTMLHTNVLGALLTLTPVVMYPRQTADAPLFGLTSLEDQQLAGLFMWVPGGAIYLGCGLALFYVWLRGPHRRERIWMPAHSANNLAGGS